MNEAPGVYVTLDELIALRHRARGFSFLPKQPIRSLLSGRRASRMRGRGLDFEEIRAYLPGDDIRSIDWKVLILPGCDADAWWTADQQGRRLLDAGAYAEAAERFEEPLWQGIALYRAGRYEEAITPFALAGAHYNRGNCHMRREEYEDAIAAYDERTAELWMRQVQTTPAEFLRLKFQYQEARQGK